MFGTSEYLRTKNSVANNAGFDAAFMGLDRVNPYPVGSVDHKQWEWGWEDGMELWNELSRNNNPFESF